MANFPQDFRTFIASTTAITSLASSTGIHYNQIPETSDGARIWFRTASDTEERTLDAVGGLHEALIDIECIADSEADAQDVADAVKNRLDGFKGTVGSHTAQGLFLSFKDDEYLPKSIASDDGRHVVAYELRAFYTT